MKYYISFNGQQYGPLDKEQLKLYGLNRDSMVWHEGLTDWCKASEIPELLAIIMQNTPPQQRIVDRKDNIVAGLLAIFLGSIGVHYFYCSKIAAGFITIGITIVTCGLWELVTFVQGIYMLTLNKEEFNNKYVNNDITFPLF